MSIKSFIFSVIENEDSTTLFKLKDKFLQAKDRPILEFTKDFFARYNKLPDHSTVEAKFNVQLIDNTESPSYWFDDLYNKYQTCVIEEAVIKSAKDKGNALTYFQQAILDHNDDIDTKVIDYLDGKRRADSYQARKGTKGITYLSTGDTDMDSFSSGYKRADLWTIGGFEGAGKSWKLLRMADNVDRWMIANNIKKNILIVSGEMEAFEMEDRLDSIRAEIAYARLSKGELTVVEERKLLKYLRNLETNIKIIDSFDGLKDIGYLQTVYRPAITFIDGSHLLAKSYDWTEIARVTADMKKMSRNQKIPIVNTTHLKSEKGKSAKGGSIDDFAYTKGYTRDSDIVGVMYASDMMQINRQIGIDWVKVRRGNRTQMVWQNDYDNGIESLLELKTGTDIEVSDDSEVIQQTPYTSTRGKKAMNYD